MSEGFQFSRAVEKFKSSWALFQKDLAGFGLMTFIGLLVAGATGGILSAPIMIGILKSVRKQEKGEKVVVKDAFSGMSQFGPAFLLMLVVGAIMGGIVGAMLIVKLIFGLTARIHFLYVILTIIWVLAAIVVYAGSAVALGLVARMGMVLISEENASFSDAMKRSVNWVKGNVKRALELFAALFLCGLTGLIPVVGGIAAASLGAMTAVAFYDEEKKAGSL